MTAVTLEESTPPPIDPNPIPPPTGGDWIDKSGTIGTETWSGNIRIVGDITLSSGATVTVGQGSSVVWAGAYRLSVGSGRSLIFNGTEEFPIVWEGWGGGHIDIRSTGGYVEKHWVRSSGSRLDSTSQTGVVPAAVIEDCLLTDFTLETFYRGVEVRRSYVGKSPGATKTFSCAPGSVFEDNILRAGKFGGSAWDGTILRNVFIAEDIDPGDSINDTGTHELMFGIKSDAVIRNNLFIGPALAHTMTIGASSGSDITFEHNTFDGRSGNHAYLNHLPNDPVQRLRFKHNLFANVGTAVHDELTTTNCVTYTDWNAFLNVNDHYKGIVMSDKLEFDPGFGANDLDVTASIFTDPQFGYPFPYSHSDMISGETTHAEMYQAYIAAYTPKEGSDVIGAGDPADGSPTLGAIAA